MECLDYANEQCRGCQIQKVHRAVAVQCTECRWCTVQRIWGHLVNTSCGCQHFMRFIWGIYLY